MEEAQAIKMFEALLDSAASEGYNSSQSSEASTSKGKSWLGGAPSVSSEASRNTAATGKAYRALKDLVEEQCKDPQLMHCGLEKCVAADGSVEWVAAHSKARLEPHLPPTAHSHTAPVPNTRVAARLSPTHRNASSARAPSASFGTSTAWKSLRTRSRTRRNQAQG